MAMRLSVQTHQRPRLRIGAPVELKTVDPLLLAKEHRRLGFRAAYCPEFATLNDAQGLRQIEESFASEDVVLAGCMAKSSTLIRSSERPISITWWSVVLLPTS